MKTQFSKFSIDEISCSARAYAKINLLLRIYKVPSDGFHELVTLYQAIDIFDRIVITDAPELSLEMADKKRHMQLVKGASLPMDHRNIVWKAISLLANYAGLEPKVKITIHKNIPVAAGLAGGSADAAATLLAGNAFWNLGLSKEQIYELGAKLGSDVPFAIHGRTAIGSNRGEVLTSVIDFHKFFWVVAESNQQLETARVYEAFDALHKEVDIDSLAEFKQNAAAEIDALLLALAKGDIKQIARLISNDLEPIAFRMLPELKRIIRFGEEAGALKGFVSGSGPTCLFLCSDKEAAIEVATTLSSLGICKGIKVTTSPARAAYVE